MNKESRKVKDSGNSALRKNCDSAGNSAGKSQTILIAVLIAAVMSVILLVHWPSLSSKALSFDDESYLTDNSLVKNPGWDSTRRFVTEVFKPSTVAGYYQPFAMISLMLDYKMGGSENNLMPFHRTSLLLHMINAALVIILLLLLFRSSWAAAVAGLVFGIHPMTIESVAWISERKTVLATFFALLCLICYVIYRKGANFKSTPSQKNVTKNRYFYLALLMYIFSLLSKPTGTMIPFALLLMDFWPLQILTAKNIKKLAIEKIPFFAVMAVSAVITYLSQKNACGVITPESYSLMTIPYIICYNAVFYIYKIVFPFNITAQYPIPDPLSITNPSIMAGIAGTIVLLVLLVYSLRKTRAFLTGWLIFFVIILPTLQIIGFTSVISSNRYAYLPSVGFLMIMAWASIRIADRLKKRLSPRVLKITFAGFAAVLLMYNSALSRDYLGYWQDTVKLYRHMISLAPKHYMLYHNLAHAFYQRGDVKGAIENYRESIRLNPDFPGSMINLGNILKDSDPDEALGLYEKALKTKKPYPSEVPKAYYDIGLILAQKGDYKGAENNYNEAIKRNPGLVEAYLNLGIALRLQNKLDESLGILNKALNMPDPHSNYPKIYYNIGVVLSMKGDVKGTLDYYDKALALKSDYAEVLINKSNILIKQGNYTGAEEMLKSAIKADPNFAEAFDNLGDALAYQKRYDDAVKAYEKVISIDPKDYKVYYDIGLIRYLQGKYEDSVKYYNKCLVLSPSFEDAYNNLGASLQAQGKIDEAMVQFKKIIEINPSSFNAHKNLGIMYQKKGDYRSAENEYIEALRLNPGQKDIEKHLNEIRRIHI